MKIQPYQSSLLMNFNFYTAFFEIISSKSDNINKSNPIFNLSVIIVPDNIHEINQTEKPRLTILTF